MYQYLNKINTANSPCLSTLLDCIPCMLQYNYVVYSFGELMRCYTDQITSSIAVIPLTAERLGPWLSTKSPEIQRWLEISQFKGESGQVCLLASSSGELQQVLLGVSSADDFWAFGVLPKKLPKGVYHINNDNNFLDAEQYQRAQLGWGLGSYQFNRYVKRDTYPAQLALVDGDETVKHLTSSIFLVRDLINTPADDMGTDQLAAVIKELAHEHKAKFDSIKGKTLAKEYPAIYAVGRSAHCEPQLVELRWGDKSLPKVTLIGKGITFDTGGLDLKPSSGMRTMKKDMGGAAHAIALARLIMLTRLPVHLRLLIPTAENAIDAHSYHPGDIIKTRAGYTVEIENTDAEGRLILCDALAAAVEEKPDYLIDFATLTGAASVALGSDIPAMYCNHDEFAGKLLAASHKSIDPIWRMPLYQPYFELLHSDIADMQNSSTVPMGGSITAALFLQKFVADAPRWVHFDLFAFNKTARMGRPIGGEAMAIRTVFECLKQELS